MTGKSDTEREMEKLRKASQIASASRTMASPYHAVMHLMSLDPSAVPEGSPGATRWLWLDRGQVKVSARLYVFLGPILAIVFLFGFVALLSMLFQGADPAPWQLVALGLTGTVLGSFALMAVWNRVVAALRPHEGTVTPPGDGDGE